MKILVSTTETQGQRDNDFCFVPEGEIVKRDSHMCDTHPDGKCGCARALAGIDCHKATTTMKVVDLPITEDELKEKIYKSLLNGGWGVLGKNVIKKVAKTQMAENVSIADEFNVGDVIEFRMTEYRLRQPTVTDEIG